LISHLFAEEFETGIKKVPEVGTARRVEEKVASTQLESLSVLFVVALVPEELAEAVEEVEGVVAGGAGQTSGAREDEGQQLAGHAKEDFVASSVLFLEVTVDEVFGKVIELELKLKGDVVKHFHAVFGNQGRS
jgi:hypothetical protein